MRLRSGNSLGCLVLGRSWLTVTGHQAQSLWNPPAGTGGKGHSLEARLGWDRLSHISCGHPGQAALSEWFCEPGCSPSGPWPTSWACSLQPGHNLRRAGGVSLPRLHHRATGARGEDRPGSLAWSPLAFAVSGPWALHSGWLMPLGADAQPCSWQGSSDAHWSTAAGACSQVPVFTPNKAGVLRGCHVALGTPQGVRQCGLGSAPSSLLWGPQFHHLSLETTPPPQAAPPVGVASCGGEMRAEQGWNLWEVQGPRDPGPVTHEWAYLDCQLSHPF